jgi:hypothetical protein
VLENSASNGNHLIERRKEAAKRAGVPSAASPTVTLLFAAAPDEATIDLIATSTLYLEQCLLDRSIGVDSIGPRRFEHPLESIIRRT